MRGCTLRFSPFADGSGGGNAVDFFVHGGSSAASPYEEVSPNRQAQQQSTGYMDVASNPPQSTGYMDVKPEDEEEDV